MKLCALLSLAALASAQPAAPPPPLAHLESNIQRVARSVNATWGIYIKCLETGEEISINADQQMDTMSVIKLPLMAEAFRQIGEGRFALTDRITLTDAAKRPGTGVIRSLDAGVQLTIKDLLTLMVTVSDNTATDLIYDKVGGTGPVNALMETWGLKSIHATGTADDWFKALRAAPNAETFHRQAKTPFGLSHSNVECVKCHIGPGAGWFVRSKLSGVGQVFAVTFHTYPEPIPTPVHNLRPARETCEACHWPQKYGEDRVKVISKYADDETNSPTRTVLLMRIGGGNNGIGIH